MDATLAAALYARASRGEERAASVVFSDKAVIVKDEGGGLNLMFQLCDLRKAQLLQCTLRCVVYKHRLVVDPVTGRSRGVFFQQSTMRLIRPNDETGGQVLLVTPTVAVHRIDGWSPLVPSSYLRDALPQHLRSFRHMRHHNFPYPTQRAADAECGSRDQFICPACGESFQTTELLSIHIQYQREEEEFSRVQVAQDLAEIMKQRRTDTSEALGALAQLRAAVDPSRFDVEALCAPIQSILRRDERSEAAPKTPTSKRLSASFSRASSRRFTRSASVELDVGQASRDSDAGEDEGPGISMGRHQRMTPEEIDLCTRDPFRGVEFAKTVRDHWNESWMEVVCILEGVEPTTGATVQSRHSYTATDIEFDHIFSPCVFQDPANGQCVIDFDKFHELVPYNDPALGGVAVACES